MKQQKNELADYIDKHPLINKSKLAFALGISKQLLEYWISKGGTKPLNTELKTKVKALK